MGKTGRKRRVVVRRAPTTASVPTLEVWDSKAPVPRDGGLTRRADSPPCSGTHTELRPASDT